MSISKDVIKSVMLDNQKDVERYELTPRNVDLADFRRTRQTLWSRLCRC